jgi:hypothetical protein
VCRESCRPRPHSGRRPPRAAPAPLSATTPEIPPPPQPCRPVRLAITVVPKIALTPGTGKPHKTPFPLPPNFSGISPNFPNPFSLLFLFFPSIKFFTNFHSEFEMPIYMKVVSLNKMDNFHKGRF